MDSLDELSALLNDSPLVRGLSLPQLQRFQSEGRVVRYREGRPVFTGASGAGRVVMLLKGAVKVSLESPDRRGRLVRLAKAPELFGISEALNRQPTLERVICLTPAVTLEVPTELFLSSMRSSAGFASAVAEQLGRAYLATLSFQPRGVEQDVATRVAALMARYEELLIDAERALRPSQAKLAEDLGLSRRTVVRGVRRLKGSGADVSERVSSVVPS